MSTPPKPVLARANSDLIESSRPVDAIAARGMMPGVRHRLALGPNESRVQPQLWKWFGPKRCDLTGKRFGWWTVLGPAMTVSRSNGAGFQPDPPHNNGALWVAKCDCGVYVTKRTRKLKKVGWHSCWQCRRKHAPQGSK